MQLLRMAITAAHTRCQRFYVTHADLPVSRNAGQSFPVADQAPFVGQGCDRPGRGGITKDVGEIEQVDEVVLRGSYVQPHPTLRTRVGMTGKAGSGSMRGFGQASSGCRRRVAALASGLRRHRMNKGSFKYGHSDNYDENKQEPMPSAPSGNRQEPADQPPPGPGGVCTA